MHSWSHVWLFNRKTSREITLNEGNYAAFFHTDQQLHIVSVVWFAGLVSTFIIEQ